MKNSKIAVPVYQFIPPLRQEEYKALEADIRKRGVMVPVDVDEEGNLLDGHNRVEIAKRLKKPYETIIRHFTSEQEKRDHVLKINLARRHLDPLRWGQLFKGLLAERGAARGRGNKSANCLKVGQLATELGVNEKTAKWRLAQADAFDKLSKPEREAVQKGDAALPDVVRKEKRRQRHEKAEAAAAERVTPITPDGSFSLLLADPPWKYEHSETDSRKIENQYPTLTTEQLSDSKIVPIDSLRADDCVLFLWATSPKLFEALQVMKAWGFDYRTNLVWVKDKIGMGYYARQQHELLLIGTRGDLPTPEPARRPSSVFHGIRTEHSQKPEESYSLIEQMYPELANPARRVELFCRKVRSNWSAWGNETL